MKSYSSNTIRDMDIIYFRALLLFPITSLFTYGFSEINKILFAFTFTIQVYLIIKAKFKVIHFYVFILLILNYLFAISETDFPLINLNDLFYYVFWVMFSLYISSNIDLVIEYLKCEEKYVMSIINIWMVLVFTSIFIPSSYHQSWGGARYFSSFTESVFRLAPTAVMIMALIIICLEIYKKKYAILYIIIPMFCFYMGGSRTYLGVGLLLLIIIWYLYCPKKLVFYTTVIPLIGVALLLISYSTTADKIAATSYTQNSYLDFWGTITNGRSIFWEFDFNAFVEQPIYKQLLGSGFNFVYEVNLSSIGAEIWAHNDFINILLNFGLLGLLLYFYSLHIVSTQLLKKCFNVPWVLKTLLFFVWFINAMFNMFYTYFCSMIAFPFIAIGLFYRYYINGKTLEISGGKRNCG